MNWLFFIMGLGGAAVCFVGGFLFGAFWAAMTIGESVGEMVNGGAK